MARSPSQSDNSNGKAAARKGRYTAPALEKAFDIIELLADNPDGALITEMAAKLGRSLGEIFRIVIVMEQRGLLQKSADTDRYTVAYKLLDLAHRATPAQKLTRAAAPHMAALALAIGQSCHLTVPNGAAGLVIAREENPGNRGFALKVGAPVDLLKSCSGHVVLAFSSETQRESMITAIENAGSRANRKGVAEMVARVNAQGFEMLSSPVTHGVTDMGYPVFGFDGTLAASLTVPFLELIDGSQKLALDASRLRLAKAAKDISAEMGYFS